MREKLLWLYTGQKTLPGDKTLRSPCSYRCEAAASTERLRVRFR